MPDSILDQALVQVVEQFHLAEALLGAIVVASQLALVGLGQQLATSAVGQIIMRAIVRRRL